MVVTFHTTVSSTHSLADHSISSDWFLMTCWVWIGNDWTIGFRVQHWPFSSTFPFPMALWPCFFLWFFFGIFGISTLRHTVLVQVGEWVVGFGVFLGDFFGRLGGRGESKSELMAPWEPADLLWRWNSMPRWRRCCAVALPKRLVFLPPTRMAAKLEKKNEFFLSPH